MQALNRQNTPPSPGPKHLIFRVESGSGFIGQIVSESLWGCWVHWDGYRTRECTARKIDRAIGDTSPLPAAAIEEKTSNAGAFLPNGCSGHAARHPLRWKGYLHVWNAVTKEYGFLELTPGAATEVLRLAPSSGNLRGLLLNLRRHGKSIRCRVEVTLTAPAGGYDKLPTPLDPEHTLRSLWGWATRS